AQSFPITYNSNNFGSGPIASAPGQGAVYTVTEVKLGGATQPLKDASGKQVATAPGDPLVLRVKAGQWIRVVLTNKIPSPAASPMPSPAFLASTTVGLHPQLVAYDMSNSNGANVGFSATQTLAASTPAPSPLPAGPAPGIYYWYTGEFLTNSLTGDLPTADGSSVGRPIEFGVINLVPSDPLNQQVAGLAGALVVEPKDSIWAPEAYVGDFAKIYRVKDDGTQGGLFFH